MLLMASSGLGIPQLAKAFPDHPASAFFAYQFDHAEWVGCSLWDLIQPAFMFMVGVALPWSIASRQAKGHDFRTMLWHALGRSAALVLLAVFLTSAWSSRTEWVFTNVLAQIGLGYPAVFLIAFRSERTQWILAGSILWLSWILFATHPLPASDFDWKSVGIPEGWKHLEGFAAHWDKNFNFAARFDRWFLNLFPREKPFEFSSGGYQTLNFLPSIATMILGVLDGRLLRSDLPMTTKLRHMVVAGVVGLVVGQVLNQTGLCPMVKRIWTPSWTIFSGGWVALLLAAFVALIEWQGWRRWTFPLIVAGVNPITLYCLWQLSGGWMRSQFKTHFGQNVFGLLGPAFTPMLERGVTLALFWLILFWMHRRKIFLRI